MTLPGAAAAVASALRRWPRRLFAVDRRSLSLFRALLGGLLVIELCRHLGLLTAFYSDAGVLPRGALAGTDSLWRISLHAANGQSAFELVLLLVAIVAALALLLGWRTRLAAITSFLLYASLLNRAPIIVGGGDMLMAALLFWACFLPLNGYWSVDSAAASEASPPTGSPQLSWASAALRIQVVLCCLLVTWLGPTDVLHALLAQPGYVSGFGWWLQAHALIPSGLDTAVHWVAGLAPLLLLAPVATRPLHALALVLLGLVQLGAILVFDLGPGPWVVLVGLTPFLGEGFWRMWAPRSTSKHPLRIYHDADRPRSRRAHHLLQTFLILPQAELRAAQAETRTATLLRANRSWIVIDHDDHAWMGWNALVILLRRSPLLWPVGAALWRLPLTRVGDTAYRLLTRIRRGQARPPARPARVETGRRAQTVAGVILLLVLLWNLGVAGVAPHTVQAVLAPPLRLLRLDQHWGRFLPSGPTSPGWFVGIGQLADGSRVDIMRGGAALDFTPPAVIANRQGGIRWHRYRDHLFSPQAVQDRARYGRALCRSWNASTTTARKLRSVAIVYLLVHTAAGQPQRAATVEQHILWQQDCVTGKGTTIDG